ncbi:MAG: HD domain-containing protein [Armatimonadota bacterium]|nr:HD domain-containing protein [Armatimonadota bacterium]
MTAHVAPGAPGPGPDTLAAVLGVARRRRPGELLHTLARARRTGTLYGFEHPVTARTIAELHGEITELGAGRSPVRVLIHEDMFRVGRTILLEESLRLATLLSELAEREVGSIEFHVGVEAWEVGHLVEILNMRPPELKAQGGPQKLLEQREARHIVVTGPRPLSPEEQVEFRVDARDVYRAGLRVVDDLYYQASRDLPLDLRKATMIVTSLIDLMTENPAALLGIAALKYYDQETAHHAVNVAILSLLTGRHLEVPRPLTVTLGLAALLHDLGKVRLPQEALTKSGPFSEEERALVRRHAFYGAHLLRNLPGLSRLAMVVAFEHHVNLNRSGYPRLVSRQAPHPLTRLVAVADFYDAATSSTRPDGGAMLPHEAMQFLQDGAGRLFDPLVVRGFVSAMGRYPVGTAVALAGGEAGVVVRPGERDAERPVVKILTDGLRRPVPPRTVRLEDEPHLSIARALDPSEVPVDLSAHLE